MGAPTCEWDREKAAANRKKHRVAFEEAATVFQDPLAKLLPDPDHSASESRVILVGHSKAGRLLLVSFTDRRVEFASSAHGLPPGVSAEHMKKTKSTRRLVDELRAEYDFDVSKAKPNPYAARLKGRAVAIVLDPDVAAVFPTSQSVNRLLRSVVAAVPQRARVSTSTGKTRGRTRG